MSASTIPSQVEFANADEFEAAHLQHIADPRLRSEQARQWADGQRAELLKAGQSLVSETVFSHESKLALIQEAQAKGFLVMLLVVAIDQPERLLARVAQRVSEGGIQCRPTGFWPATRAPCSISARLCVWLTLPSSMTRRMSHPERIRR